MSMDDEKQFQARIQQIEGLIQGIESSSDPATRARAQELLQLVLELHGAGLERMLDLAADGGDAGLAIIDGFAGDELVSSLLLLHGLHPLDLEARVMQALEMVRPSLVSHGSDVELLGIADGIVRVRLQGGSHGCGSSPMQLKQQIEEAVLAAAPDMTSLEIEGLMQEQSFPRTGFVPLEQLFASPSHPGSVVLPLASVTSPLPAREGDGG